MSNVVALKAQPFNRFDNSLDQLDAKSVAECIESMSAVDMKRALLSHFLGDGNCFCTAEQFQEQIDFIQWTWTLGLHMKENPQDLGYLEQIVD